MSTNLVKYNAACRALAEAVRVDEVKSIRDKASAMKFYAMQAKDVRLIQHATDLRLRAERRAGELLRDVEKNKGAVPGKTGSKGRPVLDNRPTLSDLGISKTQSSRWQKLADISADDFEEKIAGAVVKAVKAVDAAPKRRQAKTKSTKPKKVGTSKGIAPIDDCAMRMRELVLQVMEVVQPEQFGDLFAGLREELDNLEKSVNQREAANGRDAGHHAAHKSA